MWVLYLIATFLGLLLVLGVLIWFYRLTTPKKFWLRFALEIFILSSAALTGALIGFVIGGLTADHYGMGEQGMGVAVLGILGGGILALIGGIIFLRTSK